LNMQRDENRSYIVGSMPDDPNSTVLTSYYRDHDSLENLII
jgi:hypothetical protein